MLRRTFDLLASTAGLLLALLLILAGILLIVGHNFVGNQVSQQLSEQKITFPATGSAALTSLPAADRAAMTQYAGQMMTTGGQAKTYADHFIAVHLREIGGGKTYSQLSAESMTMPNNAALKQTVQTVFQGTTLRGLLLNAYAFGTIGNLLLIPGIISLIIGPILLALSILGFLHSRRVHPEEMLQREPQRGYSAGAETGRQSPAGPGPS